MKTPNIIAVCPHCKDQLTALELKKHQCPKNQGRLLEKQDWFKAVDASLLAAGEPEMIYAFEVEYSQADGQLKTFRLATSSEHAARRAAILKKCFRGVLRATPFTYAEYCRCFGIPGSRM